MLLDKIEKKKKTFRKYMSSKGNPEVKEYLKTNYKNIKNEITNLTRQSKKDYYKQYFTENTENLQKIWKGIREIINIKSKNYTQPTCIIEKNQTITEPKQIADSFNKYYASVAEEIIKERKYEGNKSHTEYLSHHHSFNVSVPLKVGRTAPMFVLSFFLHSILLAGSALDSFQCLRSLLIVSFHVFFGLPRPRCPTTSNSVMLLIQPSFLTTCPNQRSRLFLF